MLGSVAHGGSDIGEKLNFLLVSVYSFAVRPSALSCASVVLVQLMIPIPVGRCVCSDYLSWAAAAGAVGEAALSIAWYIPSESHEPETCAVEGGRQTGGGALVLVEKLSPF